MAKYSKVHNIWTVKHIRDGKVIWSDTGPNELTDQGCEAILETFWRDSASYAPTQFYFRLCNDTLSVTDTLSTVLNEPSAAYGYAPAVLARSTAGFPTKTQVSGVWTLTSAEVTFTASGGDIGPVTTGYIATTSDNSGLLIAFRRLSITRTVLSGDKMVVTTNCDLS